MKIILLLSFCSALMAAGPTLTANNTYCNSGCGNGSSTLTQAFGSAVTAGQLLMAITINNNSSSTTDSVSDSVNGSWGTAACSFTGANGDLDEVWVKANSAAGTPTVTATLTGNSFGRIWIGVISGAKTSTPLRACLTGGPSFSGSATEITTASSFTSTSGDLWIGWCESTQGTAAVGGNFSWTSVFNDGGNWMLEDLANAPAGSKQIDCVAGGTRSIIGLDVVNPSGGPPPYMPPVVYEAGEPKLPPPAEGGLRRGPANFR